MRRIETDRNKIEGLTRSGKALIVTMLFRMLFGGYLIAQDYHTYDDIGSALTVLGIYALLGGLTAMFLFGKRAGLAGILWFSVVLIVLHTLFVVLSVWRVDAGLHDPLDNLWATCLRYPFFLLTLIFSVGAYREKRELKRNQG